MSSFPPGQVKLFDDTDDGSAPVHAVDMEPLDLVTDQVFSLADRVLDAVLLRFFRFILELIHLFGKVFWNARVGEGMHRSICL